MYYFLGLLVRNAMCTHVYVPPNRAGMNDACMNPDVVFTVFKNCVLCNVHHALDQVYIGRFTNLWHYSFSPLSTCTANC